MKKKPSYRKLFIHTLAAGLCLPAICPAAPSDEEILVSLRIREEYYRLCLRYGSDYTFALSPDLFPDYYGSRQEDRVSDERAETLTPGEETEDLSETASTDPDQAAAMEGSEDLTEALSQNPGQTAPVMEGSEDLTEALSQNPGQTAPVMEGSENLTGALSQDVRPGDRTDQGQETLTEAFSENPDLTVTADQGAEDLTETLSENPDLTVTAGRGSEDLTEAFSEDAFIGQLHATFEEQDPEHISPDPAPSPEDETFSEEDTESMSEEGESFSDEGALPPDEDSVSAGPDTAGPLPPIITLKDYYYLQSLPCEKLPGVPRDIGNLRQILTEQLSGYEGSWSVYVKNLATGDVLYINSKPMKSASIMKLFIMGTIYDQIRAGKLERTDDLMQTMKNMISFSSNTSANQLLLILGDGSYEAGIREVNDFIRSSGFSSQTREYNGFEDDSAIVDGSHFNQVSARDCARFLEMIYRRQFISRKVCNEIEGMLLEQETRYKIPRGLPEGISAANKTGEMDSVENDVAVVYGEKSDYILCVFSDGWSDKDQALYEIQDISAQVYSFFDDASYYDQPVPDLYGRLQQILLQETIVEKRIQDARQAESESEKAAEEAAVRESEEKARQEEQALIDELTPEFVRERRERETEDNTQ